MSGIINTMTGKGIIGGIKRFVGVTLMWRNVDRSGGPGWSGQPLLLLGCSEMRFRQIVGGFVQLSLRFGGTGQSLRPAIFSRERRGERNKEQSKKNSVHSWFWSKVADGQ